FAILLAAATWLAHARGRASEEPTAEARTRDPITAVARITNPAPPALRATPRPELRSVLELPDEPPKLVETPPPLPLGGPLGRPGRTYGLDGEPVVDAVVMATAASGTASALTDETGYFRIVSEVPATYEVVVCHIEDVMHAGTYSVGKAHGAELELVFEP